VLFAECDTWQSLYRVYLGLCRVPWTLSKAADSSSDACLHALHALSHISMHAPFRLVYLIKFYKLLNLIKF
jgi:hypothetical protein